MWENPAIEVRADPPIIDHITAIRVIGIGAAFGGLDNLVIGNDVRNAITALDLVPRHARARPIRPNDHRTGQAAGVACFFVAIDDMGALCIAFDLCVGACESLGPRSGSAVTHEFIEIFPIHHANKAVFNRDIHFSPCW